MRASRAGHDHPLFRSFRRKPGPRPGRISALERECIAPTRNRFQPERMKRIILTRHALEAVIDRKLKTEWLVRVARSPEWTVPDPKPGVERRFRRLRELGDRALRVAVVEEADHIASCPLTRTGTRARPMRPETTYDPEADAVYFRFSESKDYAETTEVAPNVMLDFDHEGRLLGMEVLGAAKVLAPGFWQTAPLPGAAKIIAAE